ncbi:MAG: hypothetical protein VX012_04375 [Planctomycetota bacterium]|nr:hypothetical protein [Planctomycetota bacterium]
MSQPPSNPIVTVAVDESLLEHPIRDDAGCVASASMAALRPDRLFVAFLAVLVLWGTGLLWDSLSPTRIPPVAGIDGELVLRELVRGLPEEDRPTGWEVDPIDGRTLEALFADQPAEARAIVDLYRQRNAFEFLGASLQDGVSTSLAGVLALEPSTALRGVVAGVIAPVGTLWRNDRTFLVGYGAWAMLVLGVRGGAMIRGDVERLATERDPSLASCLRWAVGDWRRLWGTTMLPPIMAVLLLSPIAVVVGLLALVPGLDVVVAIGWLLVLVVSFAAGLVFVAWLVGLPLLVPAGAVESGDPAELTVRVVTQVRRRPWRLAVLVATAIVTGIVTWLAVSGVAVATVVGAVGAVGSVFDSGLGRVSLPAWPSLEMVPPPAAGEAEAGATRATAAAIVGWWGEVVVVIAWSWVLGFALLASGRIYLCLRRAVEHLPFDDLGEPGPRD